MKILKKKISDICSKGTSSLSLKDLDGKDGDFPVYGAAGLAKKVNFYQQENKYLAIIKDGSGVGRLYRFDGKTSVLGTMQYIFPNGNVDYSFCYYALQSIDFKKYVNGAAIPHIYFKDYSQEEIPLPPMEEQKRIAARLDAVSDLLTKQKQLLSEQDTLIQSTFYDMFGDLKCEESTIGNECILKSGTTFSKDDELDKGEYIYAKVADMNLQGNEVYIKTSRKYLSKKHVGNLFLNKGSIIFPKRGGAIRTNKKRILIEDSCVDLNIMGVSPRKKLTTQYLYVYFLNLNLESLCDGCVIPQINNKNIAPLKIPVPPLELQEKFAAIVEQIESEKSKIKSTIAETQTLFNALMAEYFEE